ncbi:50S ribosomal protein L2 [candidate division WWE3 bacterium CG10_big_fil_rev_8_21_14_0_10_32_10]|uniref:50S ribosomal protein L2 n=1 Tax=candidate division WWE3 bacterium CG10_big_fil_rev_8_21_14_0_10_32_10 TaxID=1975090 RepID=A0A2H0RAX7_UNCKA|nr:MAG: 50S ribosomal protein L2 [candidate division WWE3 bacterium CG10_big_fil_rev_8_21_14_0_10_32_10]
MTTVLKKPTSPGVRAQVNIKRNHSVQKSYKKLTVPLKGPKGRSHGTVSVHHQSRGAKKNYRIIDFKRNKNNVLGKVVSIEYDPNRNADIALINYIDGEKRYIIAVEGLEIGDSIVSGDHVEPKIGNAMRISEIPLGMQIHNIELQPNKGGQMVRGAGTYAVVTAKEGDYVNVRVPSGEVRKVLGTCFATIGAVSNPDFKNTKIGKAGRKIHMGVRPTVRGIAFSNPRDHAHGGSYKSTGIGLKQPVSRTGVPSKGYKTRRKKKSNFYKIKDRRTR